MAFTYFFRDLQTLEKITEYVIPVLRTKRYIRIWDAGCAMGPEPYTLAILLRENMGNMLFRNVSIHATDWDRSNLFGEVIEKASYSEEQVSRIPPDIFKRYFLPDANVPGNFRLSDEIAKSVTFEKHNLLSFVPPGQGYSLVLCKNVLLHFNEDERCTVIKMFYDSLNEEGFFVTEQTQKMPSRIEHKFSQIVSNAQVFKKV